MRMFTIQRLLNDSLARWHFPGEKATTLLVESHNSVILSRPLANSTTLYTVRGFALLGRSLQKWK